MEPDRHAFFGGYQQIGSAVCDPHPAQGISLVQVNGDQAALAGRIIGGEPGALDDAVFRYHHQEFILVKLRDPDHGGDLFVRLQGQEILDVHTPALAAALRHLIACQLIDAAQVGEEHDVIVASGDKQLRGHVLVPAVHAGHASAAPLLGMVGIHFLALDIAVIRQGKHAFLFGDQVLDIHLAADGGDLSAAFIGKPLFHVQGLVLYDGHTPPFAFQNIQEIRDFFL